MIFFVKNSLRTKICGITRTEDIDCALQLGADYIGLIHYQKSPRYVNEAKLKELMFQIPTGKRVYVDVCPSPENLQRISTLGFDYYQIHFNIGTKFQLLKNWSLTVKPHQLWLAPRIPGEEPFPKQLLTLANTIVLDTYHQNIFGGSGETGDWDTFCSIREDYPQTQFILAGGLKVKNIENAITHSGADFIDINSGIEKSPGIKDHQKMKELFTIISRFRNPH